MTIPDHNPEIRKLVMARHRVSILLDIPEEGETADPEGRQFGVRCEVCDFEHHRFLEDQAHQEKADHETGPRSDGPFIVEVGEDLVDPPLNPSGLRRYERHVGEHADCGISVYHHCEFAVRLFNKLSPVDQNRLRFGWSMNGPIASAGPKS